MDVFTLCFAYPSGHVRVFDRECKPVFHPSANNLSSDLDVDVTGNGNGNGNGNGQGDDGITSYQQHADSQFRRIYPSVASHDQEFDAVHQTCIAISTATGCLVSAVRQEPEENSKNGSTRNDGTGEKESDVVAQAVPRGWDFQLSGGYAQVMDARRRIMAAFRPDVKTSIKIPAIHVLQSIHSSPPYSTPLHPSQHDLSPPSLSSATPPIKPDVRVRLQAIEERTGAKISVRVLKEKTAAFGEGTLGFGNRNNVQAAQPSAKLPWTMQQSSSPPLAAPMISHPGIPISDSARSKSMYPFLPAHQMPQVAEQYEEKSEEITRTDSPECIASPESISIPLRDDVLHSAGNVVDIPTANTEPTNPSSIRSKTIDVPRPRVAGLKSPLPCPPSAVPPSTPGTEEEAMLEELKVWGFAETPVCVVDVQGREECVRMARVLVLVLVDELTGLSQDTCEIDFRLQYILAGRKRATINAIQEETNTNIYLVPTTSTVFLPYTTAPRDIMSPNSRDHLSSPIIGIESTAAPPSRGDIDLVPTFIPSSVHQTRTPLTADHRPIHGLQDSIARLCVSSAQGEASQAVAPEAYIDSLGEMKSRVWVTGDVNGVHQAKEMLSRVAFSRKQTVFTKEAEVVPSKLDWVVQERHTEIERIMSDNGSHVEFLPGARAGVVRVYGDHRVSVERTMKHVMLLFGELTLATVFTVSQPLTEAPEFDASLESVLKATASSIKAEVAYRAGQFQVCGTMAEVQKALPLILTSDAVKDTSCEIRFQCELAVEHTAFLAGKRDGKKNKIMRATACQIKFDHLNNQNFLIDIHGPGLKVLEALQLLQDELPSEISFHIPESYHRRIIGKGGTSIQDVMRRHSAFVKFSSTEQWQFFGGHHRNEDNVICITPSKNKQALFHLKADLMLSILTKDRDYDDWIITIDRKYHRALQAETRAYLHHIEVVHGAVIRFLPREDGQDAIEVYASKYQATVIRDALSKILPIERTVSYTIAIELAKVAASPEWLEFTTSALQDLQISILPYSQLTAGGESIFVLKCQRQNLCRMKEAKSRLGAFLKSQQVTYTEPFDWTYGMMTSRSQTMGHHRRTLSTVPPQSASIQRAGTIGLAVEKPTRSNGRTQSLDFRSVAYLARPNESRYANGKPFPQSPAE